MTKVKLNPTIREQILTVRDTGRTNMFDIVEVISIAYELDLYELVDFLADSANHSTYSHFIMFGDSE